MSAGGSPAAAEPIEHDHFHDVTSEVLEDFCGDLTVRFDVDSRGTFLLNAHRPDGLAYGLENVHSTVTVTNLANGKTFTEVFNQVSRTSR